MPPHRPLIERFSEKYEVDATTGCWLWKAAVTPTAGYGMINAGRGQGNTTAHRVSYRLHKGPVPPGANVLHRCDTPACVNPDHLYLGTHADNMRDMAVRNRAKGLQRADQIEQMLTLLESGVPQAKVAAVFGVDRTTIQRTLDRIDIGRQASPAGYTRPAGGHRYLTVAEREEVGKLLQQGRTVSDVARQFRVSRTAVRKYRAA